MTIGINKYIKPQNSLSLLSTLTLSQTYPLVLETLTSPETTLKTHSSPSPYSEKLGLSEMDGFGSGHRYGGGDRRLEVVVSGKGFGSNQDYATRPGSPGAAPVPQRVTRASQAASKPWGFNDSEMKRKKRIAKYKVYTVEGKVKASLRNGLRWIKNKCSQIVRGY